MKIGIFTNYAPNIALNTEGLGRYLGTLIKGFIENDDEVTLACPKWSEKSVRILLDDLGIDIRNVRLLTTKNVPVLWKIYDKHSKTKVKKQKIAVAKAVEKILIVMSKKKTYISFGFSSILLAVASMLFGLFYCFLKVLSKLKGISKRIVRKCINALHVNEMGSYIFSRMLFDSEEELVNLINENEPMDTWYVPALFWPSVNNIQNQKVIINAPDLVTSDFASGFADCLDAKQTIDCERTLINGKYFITYSDYIGHELIDKKHGGMGKVWKTILHANHDLLPSVKVPVEISKQMNVDKDFTQDFAKTLISQVDTGSAIFTGIHLKNAKYLFYASQSRPHKNLLNLVKAYELLIRKRFRHEKLVLTGNPNILREVQEYIMSHDLANDIIFCHGVSNQELAALYYCAELVVNPTLYEGGFPFTFGEGMSVGTPSIMSDIPQVRQVLEEEGLSEIMFDPTDFYGMADKIEWALDNLNYLYDLELPLYKKMTERTDSVVADEYRHEFERMALA